MSDQNICNGCEGYETHPDFTAFGLCIHCSNDVDEGWRDEETGDLTASGEIEYGDDGIAEAKPIRSERFPRKCERCGKGMEEGYLFGDECYHAECAFDTVHEWQKWLTAYEIDGDSFWTTWSLEDGEPIYSADGQEFQQ